MSTFPSRTTRLSPNSRRRMRSLTAWFTAFVLLAQTFATTALSQTVLESGVGVVEGEVWVDADADGVRDDGEEGLGGVRLVLYDGDLQVSEAVSTGSGEYRFAAVSSGSYRVEADLPDGYDVAPQPDGASDDAVLNGFSVTSDGEVVSDPVLVSEGGTAAADLGLVAAQAEEEPTDTTLPETTTTTVPTETTTTTVPATTTTTAAPESTTTTWSKGEEISPEADGPGIAPLSINTPDTFIHEPNTWYAYVEAGENLDVSFVKSSSTANNEATVRVRGPGGVDQTCTVPAGPGAADCTFVDLNSVETGVWQIDYTDAVVNSDRYTWAIDVQAGTSSVDGRVYSERYAIGQFSGLPAVDFSLWYQSEQGFLYRAAYLDYHGIDSSFTSDSTGVAHIDTCVAAYESIDRVGPDSDMGEMWVPAADSAGTCGDPYKIFFEEPAADLPASASLWDGSTQWLQPPVTLPTVSNLGFTGDSFTVRSGEFTFDVTNFTGQLGVQIDVNNDGDYDDSVDRVVQAAATDGTVTVPFDGLDGEDNPIPATADLTARVVIDRVGEIHFVNGDVETRAGLEVQALNGPQSGSFTLYWNDTQLETAGRIGTIPPLDGTAGVDSSGGVHGWPCSPLVDCNANDGVGGSWGDARYIDDWTYHTIDESVEAEIPGEDLPPFECSSTAFLFQQVPTDIWEGDLVTGQFEEVASDIEDTHINGIGFNVLDGYIYGWSNSAAPGGTTYPAGLVRIGSDHNVEYLGIPDGLSESTLIGHGDVDTDGYYWARLSDVDPNQWVQIDLRPGSATFGEVLAEGDLIPPTGLSLQPDWSYNPADGLLYGLAAGTGDARHLITFDPTTGDLNDEGQLSSIVGGAFGATYMDADGFLYASDNLSGDIYRIDVADATAEFFADGPGDTGQNDGARCAEAPLPVDFGDADDGYGTTLAANGPRHAIPGYDAGSNTAPLMLGDLIDIETDGQPSADAGGDGADEDGVADPIEMVPGQPTTVTVNATNTSGDVATLVGWIDLDNDGTFEDGEWDSVPVPDGSTAVDFDLTFDPPAFLGTGAHARFRLFPGTVIDPEPIGPAAAGEVEDYPVLGPFPEPWTCETNEPGLLFQDSETAELTVNRVDLVTGEYLTPTAIPGYSINATGYNIEDGYIYGWDNDGEELVAIGSDGNVVGLDQPDGMTGSHFIGDVDDAGHYWTYAGGTWYDVDLATMTVDSGTLTQPTGVSEGLDWAFIPGTDSLWRVVTFNGQPALLGFDRTSHTWTTPVPLANMTAGLYGAVFADADGFLYASHNDNGEIWRVDLDAGTAAFFSQGQPASGNDGARCFDSEIIIDFGDAPDSYGTTLASGGPRHGIPGFDEATGSAPLMLGSIIDPETDGVPTADADGDDLDRIDDEDGVTGPIVLLSGLTTTVDVDVTNTSGGDAILAGWIDLDVNGVFDPGELVTQPVPDGTVGSVQLEFPAATGFGDTYARFRLFPDDGVTPITPTGPAPAGEVEDYPVTGMIQEPWECPPDGLLFQYPDGTPTEVQFVDLVTGFVDTDAMSIDDRGINAAAYNISDNYVYGWDNEFVDGSTTERVGIVRIGPDESVDVLGVPDHPELNPAWTFPVGDIDSNGHYWVINSTGSSATTRWFQIDLNPGPTFMEVLDTGMVDGDAAGYVGSGDWAWIPNHDAIYRVMRETGITQWTLFRFDRSTGEHQNLGLLPAMNGYNGTFGAAYADPDFLYVADNASGDIFRIDIDTVSAELFVEDGPPSGANDAARCATAPITLDLGDAPDSYGTSLASDGARHGIPGFDVDAYEAPLMLGTSIDDEPNGFPTAGADGDDNDNVDDEDGVTSPIVFLAGQETSVDVTVTNDTADDATLVGWIDLNGDGDFDANERSQTLVTVPAGTTGVHTLTFDAGTATTDTYARFRLYPGVVADPQPTGPASAGEVEDYFVQSGLVHYEKTVTPDDVAVLQPGETFTYTVTVSNQGSVPLTDASFTDDLSGVVGDGDATYNNDVAVVSGPGTASFTPDVISWDLDGDILDPGEQAVVEYTVTIADPPAGDGILANGVIGTGPGSNCVDDPATDPDCYVEIPQPQIEGAKTSDAGGDVEPGQTITYQFTVTNVGPGPALNAVVWDDLTGVLDDAVYNGDAQILAGGPGAVSYDAANERLVWNGPLDAAGGPVDSVTIEYTVTVNEADSLGDGSVRNALLMTGCPFPAIYDPADPDYDPDCVVVEEVEAWTTTKTSDAQGLVEAGDTVTYTVEIENTGNVDLTAADVVVADDLTDVLDDAVYNGDADDAGHPGTFDFTSPLLTWSGDLTVDEVVTLTYSVTVNEPDALGNGQLVNAVTGGDCPDPAVTDPADPGFDPDCVTIEDVAAYTVVKDSVTPNDPVLPGDTVTYTLTVENTGNIDLSAADVLVEDDLADVLDNAAYNNDADQGAVFSDPFLSWSDDLAVDEVVVVTYSVTVNDADDLGDGQLVNAVTGGDCPDPAITDPQDPDFDPDCVTIEDIRAYTVHKTSSAPNDPVLPGDMVSYTVVVENTGNIDLIGPDAATFSDDLTDVLDDAAYNGDALADIGTATFNDPVLDWSGDLVVDGVATITYSVTVNDADDLGDGQLTNAVTGGDCPDPAVTDPTDPDFDPDCVTIEDVEAWTVAKSSDAADPVLPGDTITYTITVENTGNVDLAASEVLVEDDLTDVLDDAAYNNDADQGATYAEPIISWSDDLAMDDVVVITYSVTVNDADDLGDGQLVNAVTGGDCPAPAITDPADPDFDADCVTIEDVEAWTVTKTSDAADPVRAGDTITYTLTVENTGNVDLPAAEVLVEDDLTDVLDDAAYNNDVDQGATFAEPVITWSDDLAVDEVVVITYSVTVNDADSLGDGVLVNAVTGGDCPDPAVTDPQDPDFDGDCVVIEEIGEYTVVKTSDAPDPVLPGDTITYTVTVENTGGTDLVGADAAAFSDDLSGVLDDATYNDNGGADIGTATFSDPVLSWTGDLAVGEVATITYSVTVDQPITGDHQLVNAVMGGDCPDPAVTDPQDPDFDPDCVTVTPLRGVDITKVIFGDPADELQPGDSFEYVVTVENIGQVDLVGETFTDDLSEVLDDAVLDTSSITADIGTATFSDPELTWTGDLTVGDIATVRYTITIDDPVTGDGELFNAVVGSVYSNCVPPDPDDPDCWEETPIPSVYVSKEPVGPDEPQPGDVVTYRITVENRGGAVAVDEEITDDLSGVLDDAVYNGDADADSGSIDYTEPILTWTGNVPAGGTVEITYSVTVNAAGELGDAVLENGVTGGENCPDDDGCTTSTPLPDYEAVKVLVSPESPEPGDVVTYEITITNNGEGLLEDGEITDDLSDVLDDAAYNGDATASIGAVSVEGTTLTWTGDLAAGEIATVRYSVTVNDGSDLGDGRLINIVTSPNCPAPSTQDDHEGMPEDCVTDTPLPAVEYRKSIVSPAGETVRPGEAVKYRIEVFNRGGTDLDDASFTDDLSDVLENAAYLKDAVATTGSVSYAEPVLTWTGDLPVDGSATVEYSLRIDRDVRGDVSLDNRVVGDGPATNCPVASPSVACVSNVVIDVDNPLPHTGAYVARLAAVAAVLLLLGWALVTSTRRRRAI